MEDHQYIPVNQIQEGEKGNEHQSNHVLLSNLNQCKQLRDVDVTCVDITSVVNDDDNSKLSNMKVCHSAEYAEIMPNSLKFSPTDKIKRLMDEFQFNLLLLLHNRYPEGMLLNTLEKEYEKYFLKSVKPEMFCQNFSGWSEVIENTHLSGSLWVSNMKNGLVVKTVAKRSETIMIIIAALFNYDRLFYYETDKKSEEATDSSLNDKKNSYFEEEKSGFCLDSENPPIVGSSNVGVPASGTPSMAAGRKSRRKSPPSTIEKCTYRIKPGAVSIPVITHCKQVNDPADNAAKKDRFKSGEKNTEISTKLSSKPPVKKLCKTKKKSSNTPLTPIAEMVSDKNPQPPEPSKIVARKRKSFVRPNFDSATASDETVWYLCETSGCEETFLNNKAMLRHTEEAHPQDSDIDMIIIVSDDEDGNQIPIVKGNKKKKRHKN